MHFCNCLGINIIVNSIRKLIYDIAKADLSLKESYCVLRRLANKCSIRPSFRVQHGSLTDKRRIKFLSMPFCRFICIIHFFSFSLQYGSRETNTGKQHGTIAHCVNADGSVASC